MWVCLVPPIAALFANGVCVYKCASVCVWVCVRACVFVCGVRGGFLVRMRPDLVLLQDWSPYPVLRAAIPPEVWGLGFRL